MAERPELGVDSPGVRTHLTIVQGVIQRMADNSRSCKFWCVTLVAATLILVARTGEPRHALIALVPTALFLVLDTYYLALEQGFRKSYEMFVGRLHQGKLDLSDIYEVKATGKVPKLFRESLASFSIWPFYILLIVTILVAWLLIL